MQTINQALNSVQTTRNTLATLIVLVVTLSQRITAARDQYKITQDEVIAEIWSDAEYKNDKQRNEQKHLAMINDERLTAPLAVIAGLEMERAQAQADVITQQNVLTIATAQYTSLLTASPFAGMQLVMAITESVDVDGVRSLALKQTTETVMPDAAPVTPDMAQRVLAEYQTLTADDMKICDIVAAGDTRFLDGAALDRVRDLYAALPASTVGETSAPVETVVD